MTAAHDTVTALLGPAALGLLTSVEQQQLDRHLRACAQCRSELAGLMGVVDRLGELDDEPGLMDELQPSAARAEAVLAAVAADRTRTRSRARRWQAVLAAAASVAVLAAGVVAATAIDGTGPRAPLEAVAVQAPPGVEASADLVPHTWGVEIKLAATGLAAGRPYTVQVLTAAGQRVDAGAFLGTGERPLLCNLNASVLRADAVGFVVRDAAGEQVLAADL
jgi:hypothetical protein